MGELLNMVIKGMNRKARIVKRISKAVGQVRPWNSSSGLRVLLYHSVGGKLPSEPYDLSVEPQRFLDQMQWLRQDSRCEIVSLEEGIKRLHDGNTTPLVAVTFDDGYRDNLSIAAPILSALQIPFTVFVTAAFLERGERGDDLYLTHNDLRSLSYLNGVRIGAHGYSHRPLTRLSNQELHQELERVKQHIETVINQPVTALSYPHGAVNRLVRQTARSVGYELGATSLIGVNRSGIRPFMLRRTEVVGDDGLEEFSRKLRGDYDWCGLKQRLYWPVPPL